MRRQTFQTIGWCLLLALPVFGQPENWQVLKFPGPSGPVDPTWCFGINPRGDMVGYFVQPPERAFLLSQGTYSAIDAPGGELDPRLGN